jgi:hypothetical protein
MIFYSSQKFDAADFRLGTLLAPLALSIGWAVASNMSLRLIVVSLSLYCGVALLLHGILMPIQRRIVFQAVSAETSQSLVCVITFLVAASIAHFIAKPPFSLLMQCVSFVVCGIACYTVLPFSRFLSDTFGIFKGILASSLFVVVISPVFMWFALIFMSGGRNTSSATMAASLTLGKTELAEINFLALILAPLIAAILGVMHISLLQRQSSR